MKVKEKIPRRAAQF